MLKMNELLERLYAELRHFGPNDKFNKGFYLTLTEKIMKDMEAEKDEHL